MKKTFIAIAAVLGMMMVSCNDEILDTYEDQANKPTIEIVEPDTIVVTDSIEVRGDSISNGWDEEVKYPIGFSVTVNDYKEVD